MKPQITANGMLADHAGSALLAAEVGEAHQAALAAASTETILTYLGALMLTAPNGMEERAQEAAHYIVEERFKPFLGKGLTIREGLNAVLAGAPRVRALFNALASGDSEVAQREFLAAAPLDAAAVLASLLCVAFPLTPTLVLIYRRKMDEDLDMGEGAGQASI